MYTADGPHTRGMSREEGGLFYKMGMLQRMLHWEHELSDTFNEWNWEKNKSSFENPPFPFTPPQILAQDLSYL